MAAWHGGAIAAVAAVLPAAAMAVAAAVVVHYAAATAAVAVAARSAAMAAVAAHSVVRPAIPQPLVGAGRPVGGRGPFRLAVAGPALYEGGLGWADLHHYVEAGGMGCPVLPGVQCGDRDSTDFGAAVGALLGDAPLLQIGVAEALVIWAVPGALEVAFAVQGGLGAA